MKAGSEAPLISIDQYEPVMVKVLTERKKDFTRDSYHHLMRAFRAFDTDKKGYLEVEELKQIMTGGDLPFTEQELDEMIAFSVDQATNRIYYEDYSYKLAYDGEPRASVGRLRVGRASNSPLVSFSCRPQAVALRCEVK